MRTFPKIGLARVAWQEEHEGDSELDDVFGYRRREDDPDDD